MSSEVLVLILKLLFQHKTIKLGTKNWNRGKSLFVSSTLDPIHLNRELKSWEEKTK